MFYIVLFNLKSRVILQIIDYSLVGQCHVLPHATVNLCTNTVLTSQHLAQPIPAKLGDKPEKGDKILLDHSDDTKMGGNVTSLAGL